MILFINGPFGVGKPSVARVLVQKMAHVEACLMSSRHTVFGTEICTEGRTTVEVASQILRSLDLKTG